MRAFAVFTVLAVNSICSGATYTDHDREHSISSLLFATHSPVQRIADCSRSLGLVNCVSALSAWRAKHAAGVFTKDRKATFDFIADIQHFPWQQYNDSTDDQLYSELCEGTQSLLQYRSLKLNVIPGYTFQLGSKGNGTFKFDILRKSDSSSARGSMKKLQKKFYNIVPYLLIPGLIMSAILPFILPALKMMTVGVGMLNNMALSGAIFTLLRNNAFNDYYEKKVVYYNAGYKNEKHASSNYEKHLYHINNEDFHTHPLHGGQATDYILQDPQPGDDVKNIVGQYASNLDWIKQYYGENKYNISEHTN